MTSSSIINIIISSLLVDRNLSFSNRTSTESHNTTIADINIPSYGQEYNNLLRYSLDKINKDRVKFGLEPVKLSQNKAAQIEAEDALKTGTISHWTSNGYKPYILYSLYGGHGFVRQNIAGAGYNSTTTGKCKQGLILCKKINPYNELYAANWNMLYNDTRCCNNGHRGNILDKYHTDVSIGIAYNDYFFVLVQNFENNYIQFYGVTPREYRDSSNNNNNNNQIIQVSGTVINPFSNEQNSVITNDRYELKSIGVYYDELPTHLLYESNKIKNSYSLGKFIALIVKPLPLFLYYEKPSNFTLIQANLWNVERNGKEFNISFDLLPIIKFPGVYTILIDLLDKQDNNTRFPASSYSIIVKK
jgi:uncharacterized protein YkwD